MKTLSKLALAGVFGLGLISAAQAQSTSPLPSVPNPANPYPLNPVATDGTPLPRYNGIAGGGLYSGRSAFVPAGGIVGAGVDTGLGIAGDAVGTGPGVAGRAVNGSLGSVDGFVR